MSSSIFRNIISAILFVILFGLHIIFFCVQPFWSYFKRPIRICLSNCLRKISRQDVKKLLTKQFVNNMLNDDIKRNKTINKIDVTLLESCGDGKASTTDRTHLRIEFNINNTKDEKETHYLVFKAVLLPWYMRLGSSIPLIKLTALVGERIPFMNDLIHFCINFYNYYLPQAPDAMYINETLIYSKILQYINNEEIEHPKCYGTLFNPNKCQYFILMEDLSTYNVQFPTALNTLKIPHVKQLLKSLALLHSKFWHSKRFKNGNDLSWVVNSEKGGMYEVFRSIGKGLIKDHVRRNKFEQEILKPLGLTIDEMWECLISCEKMFCSAKNGQTLCHGDTHIQNTYVIDRTAGVKVGLLDWQLSLQSHWCRDVAYILGTALTPIQRHLYEKELLKDYLNYLTLNGINWKGDNDIEDFQFQFKYRYSVSMCWGLVIGWLICPANNYGEAILSANLKRLVAACIDLKTFDIIKNDMKF